MRIAIDCRPIVSSGKGEMAGIGHYARFLVRHLLRIDEENSYVLLFDADAGREAVGEALGSSRNAEVRTLAPSRIRRFLPYAYAHRYVPTVVSAARADLYHGTTGSLPLGWRGRGVVTVHDLAIYAHPEWFPGGQFFSRRVVVPASVRRAARVIAVSHFTKREVQRVFGVPAERIAVVHEGVEPPAPGFREASLPQGLKAPYLLHVGTIEPRKNIEGLVEAYALLAERHPALVGTTELVLAGGRGWKSEKAFAAIDRANRRFGTSGPRVRVLGYVSEAEKNALLAQALVSVFPSRHEGFGLPVLEAMSFGTPVITSDVTAMTEIAGRGAALLVSPERPSDLALAMRHLLEDARRRADLGRRGLERSTDFRWDKTAGETLEAYEAALKAKS